MWVWPVHCRSPLRDTTISFYLWVMVVAKKGSPFVCSISEIGKGLPVVCDHRSSCITRHHTHPAAVKSGTSFCTARGVIYSTVMAALQQPLAAAAICRHQPVQTPAYVLSSPSFQIFNNSAHNYRSGPRCSASSSPSQASQAPLYPGVQKCARALTRTLSYRGIRFQFSGAGRAFHTLKRSARSG